MHAKVNNTKNSVSIQSYFGVNMVLVSHTAKNWDTNFYLGLLMPLLSKEFPILISAPFSLLGTLSTVLVIITEKTLYFWSKSTLHQGLKWAFVWVQEPWPYMPSRFPSMALYANPFPQRSDWVAFPLKATFSPAWKQWKNNDKWATRLTIMYS